MEKDSISALMDGELSDAGWQATLSALRDHPEAVETWREYHLIREILRGEHPQGSGVESRILQALAQEPVVLAPRLRRAVTPLHMGLAAAAAVAMVVGSLWILGQPSLQESAQPMAAAVTTPENLQVYVDAHRDMTPGGGLRQVDFPTITTSGRGETPR